jgi:hypothetical protein
MADDGTVNLIGVALTDSQLKAIGLVCHHWAVAESVLEHLIWAVFELDLVRGQALTTHIGAVTRTEIIAAALEGQDTQNDMAKISAEYNELRGQRNLVVHATWAGTASDLGVALKRTAHGRVAVAKSYWSAEDINALAEDIEEWVVETINYISRTFGWPQASQVQR